jgi:hypothetical protein
MKYLFWGAVVGIGIGLLRYLTRVRPPEEYLSERWLKAQSYDRKGQGGWI